MMNFLMDACGSVYCLHRPQDAAPRAPGEVFDQHDDWQPAAPAPKAFRGTTIFALCAVLLVAGLALAV